MTLEERLRSHYESLSRIIGFTRSADAKAAPVLALQVALVGTLAARFEKLLPVVVAEQWHAERVVLTVLIGLYLVFLISVVVLAALVYMPMNPRTGKSLIYFEDIASMGYKEFEAQAKGIGAAVIEQHLLDQIHRVSAIASTKMRRVRWAFLLSGPASILWIVLLGWGSVYGNAS